MSNLIISGVKRSAFNFMKISVTDDLIEYKNAFLPKKRLIRSQLTGWTEVRKRMRNAGLEWLEVTVYGANGKITINSMHWNNFDALRSCMTTNVRRDTELEQKIYKSFW